jgi:hypothetical protein
MGPRSFRALKLLLFLAIATRIPAEPSPSRQAASSQAAQVLLDTHLFAGGQGMYFTAPGVIPLFQIFESPWLPMDINGLVGRRLGLNMRQRRAVGMYVTAYKGAPVVAMGCVLCHSGRAAGRFVVGLGNKRIDVGEMGSVGHAMWPLVAASPSAGLLKDPRWTNTTKGLVPDALIQQWFYRSAGLSLPPDLPAAEVKPPHLWGYGEKRKIGLFCDGFGDGSEPGWAAMVELASGQTPETVRSYRTRLDEVEHLLEQLLPPSYPFSIDQDLAGRGLPVFQRTCSGCHGEYSKDSDGLPIYQAPRFIPWDAVETDHQRLLCITPEFRRLVESNPLNDMIRAQRLPPGYFAPRLDGIWARFPYLHNASAPTIRDLLTPVDRRPQIWSLADAGELQRFDREALGLAVPRGPGLAQARLRLQARLSSRDIYITSREGHSNQGHAFGSTLPEEQKRALIEYLKTL